MRAQHALDRLHLGMAVRAGGGGWDGQPPAGAQTAA